MNTFSTGNRHNYLVDMAERLKDAGLSKNDALYIVTSYSRDHGDTEDRSYIVEGLYNEGDPTTMHVLTARKDNGDTEVVGLFDGPVGVSFQFLQQQFAGHVPEGAEYNSAGNLDAVEPHAFCVWLAEQAQWTRYDMKVEQLPTFYGDSLADEYDPDA